MNFFKKFSNVKEKHEEIIKETILNSLNQCGKEIHYEFKEKNKDTLEFTESTNALCYTLEAIFLHGLKDSFLWQTINVLSDNIDYRPELNFWSLLLVFLHSDTINQIESLSQIVSEVGYCRAWIRLSLNESIFSSYLSNIRKNSNVLGTYYKKHAFLKDSDQVDIAEKILQGIEACVQINLPINSSLLNSWNNQPLQLAGVWTPPLKTCPITSGEDVASSLPNDIYIPKPLRSSDCFTESISNSPFRNLLLNRNSSSQTEIDDDAFENDMSESERFNVFLQKIDELEDTSEPTILSDEAKELLEEIEALEKNEETTKKTTKQITEQNTEKTNETIPNNNQENVQDIPAYGNSISCKKGWSEEPENNEKRRNLKLKIPEDSKNLTRSNSLTASISSIRSPVDFNTLLIKHEKNLLQQENNLINDVWSIFEMSLAERNSTDESKDENEENLLEAQEDEFEVIARTVSEKFSIEELHQMVAHLCKLGRESGLHSQGFLCKGCSYPLGIGFANAKVCVFTGSYFCEQCVSETQFTIPAKIIYNWDFQKYTVSRRASEFLMEFQNQPFIDLKILNPEIYRACEEMDHIQSLRVRLNFIRAYLYTCSKSSESATQQLQNILQSKVYLYEHIHKYSILDLIMIQQGQFTKLLEKAVKYGEEHILKCDLCRLKGFICEICNSPKVIYPFYLDTTYRCQICGAVFHQHCSEKFLNHSQLCPKCERKRKRDDDLSLSETMAIQHL